VAVTAAPPYAGFFKETNVVAIFPDYVLVLIYSRTMDPINPQIDKRAAYREHQANQRKVLGANGYIIGDQETAIRANPSDMAAINKKAKSVRRENKREIDTAYAVKSGATMAELAAKGEDLEVSGDALRRAKAGQKPKIQYTL
jgi:hypothetical protein